MRYVIEGGGPHTQISLGSNAGRGGSETTMKLGSQEPGLVPVQLPSVSLTSDSISEVF